MPTARRNSRRALLAAAALATTAAMAAPVTAQAAAPTGPTVTVIASNLLNPRKITVLPDGGLLVAESGAGLASCAAGQTCAGATGAIYLADRHWQGTVVSGLESAATTPTTAGSALEANGPVQALPDGHGGFVVLAGTDNATTRAALGPAGAVSGTLYRAGSGQVISDLVGYEFAHDPDGQAAPESNPFGMVATPGGGWQVADAGANDVLGITANGTTTTTAVIPYSVVAGTSQESVPSAVVRGHDGALYVSDLGGMQTGGSQIWRLLPGRAPQLVAGGLTDIVDLAVDPQGNLVALSLTAGYGATGAAPGGLFKISTSTGQVTAIPTGDLLQMPTGLAIGPQGQIYVSNNGTGTDGQLVQVHP